MAVRQGSAHPAQKPGASLRDGRGGRIERSTGVPPGAPSPAATRPSIAPGSIVRRTLALRARSVVRCLSLAGCGCMWRWPGLAASVRRPRSRGIAAAPPRGMHGSMTSGAGLRTLRPRACPRLPTPTQCPATAWGEMTRPARAQDISTANDRVPLRSGGFEHFASHRARTDVSTLSHGAPGAP